MDYFTRAPYWAIGIQCQCCDQEIDETNAVYADAESASDTGDSRTVAHVGCYVSVQTAKAEVLLEAAKIVLHNGHPDLAIGLELRARRIESGISKHNEARH